MRGVFIGRRFNEPVFVLSAGLSLLGLVAGVAFFVFGHTPPRTPLVVGWGVVTLVAAARGGWVAADRRRMLPAHDGVLVRGRGGSQLIPHEAVTALGFWDRPHYSWGTAEYRLVTGELTVGDGESAVRVPFSYQYGLNDLDPLRGWRVDLIEHLEERAARAVAGGGAFATDHWHFSRDGLTWAAGGKQHHIPADEVAAVGVADRAFCVWRAGDERAAFRLPAGSANALVLWGVLERFMPEQPAGEPREGNGLGRVLFDRSTAGSGRWLVAGLGAFVLFIGLAALGLDTYRPNGRPDARILGWAFTVFGVLLGMIVLLTSRGGVTIYSHGVCQKGWFGSRRLRFADLASMWWTETRNYYNYLYTGTDIRVRLKGYDGTEVRFRIDVNNVDFDLNGLRQTAADHVARRLRSHLSRGRRVRWVGRLTFTPDGLAVAPWLGWFGGREQVLPYWSLGRTCADGKLHLDCGGRRVTVGADVSAENFQPGLVLLDLLRTEPMPAGGYRT
jgi:hypothetical protein